MNKNIYEAPLVLFLGAGASKPLGLKTTPEFWEYIRYNSNFDIQLLNAIGQSIEPSEEIGGKPDIEAVLDFLEKINEGRELEKALYHDPYLNPFKLYLETFESASPLRSLREIKEKIKDLIVEHYSEIDPQKAFELYRPLIETVIRRPLLVFTTNYDLAWEKTYDLTSDPSYDLREAPFNLIDGFRRQRIATPRWLSSEYDNYEPTGADVILFKLHGSVDWRRTSRGAIQRFESGKRDHEIVLAYPSRLKKEIHEEPLRTNYDYLLHCLLHAKVCAVIGFSFRDQEIVEEFRQAMKLNINLELIIIDPNAEAIEAHLQNKLGFRPKAELIKREFAIESSQYIADRIKNKAVG